MKYKDYFNFELGNRDIYSHNDILGMTVQDLFDNELPLSYQYNTIGIPKDDELSASPNTHQYTNANGKLRWRSSSKTWEELLEEERQRGQMLQMQNQNVQSQLGSMTGGAAPVNNLPQQEPEAAPIQENELSLLNTAAQNALTNILGAGIDKLKTKPQQTTENPIIDAAKDYIENETKESQSPIMQALQSEMQQEPVRNPFDPVSQESELKAPVSISDTLPLDFQEVSEEELSRIGQDIASTFKNMVQERALQQQFQPNKTLEGMVIKEAKKPGLLDKLRTKVKEFNELGFNKEDDLNLQEEVQDRYDKLVNNKTDYSAPMTKKEQMTDWILKNKITTRGHFPVAADMYTDAMTDFSRARSNPNAEVLENMDSLDENTRQALLDYGVKHDSRGVHYNENSKAAEKFAKSRQLKQFFIENEDAIKNGEIKEYSFNFGVNDSPAIRENIDRYASLQHAKLINPYIDENGNMHGTLIDNYDFERRPVKNILNGKNIINNHGYNMQEKGNLENYFTTFDINSKPDWHYYWLRNKYKKRR